MFRASNLLFLAERVEHGLSEVGFVEEGLTVTDQWIPPVTVCVRLPIEYQHVSP